MYPSKPQILTAFFLALCLLGIFNYQTNINTRILDSQNQEKTEFEHQIIEMFNSVPIEAKSVIVKDIDSGEIIFERSSFRKMPLASLTKIMTAYVSQKYSSKDAEVKISEDDLYSVGDAKLNPGDTWKLKSIVSFALVNSSNDAISSITRNLEKTFGGEDMFVDTMNREARDLGLYSMKFYNTTGLDIDSETNGGYGSAGDVALLFEEVFKTYPDSFTATTFLRSKFSSLSGVEYESINTNPYTEELAPLLASKTGYTSLTGGNLAIIKEIEGRRIILVVLGSSYNGRFRDMINLSKKVEEYFPLKIALDAKYNGQ